MRVRGLVPLVCAFSVVATAMLAQPVKVGPEFQINTYTTNSQYKPSAAMDAGGNFVVVWRSQNQVSPTSSYDIFGQRFDSAGNKQGPEFQVNTYTTNVQDRASVAMDPAGNFVVVWTDNYQDGSQRGIFGQRFDSNGVKQGSEFLVNTYTTDEQHFASAAMDGSGNFVVVWHSYGQLGGAASVRDIFGQRFNSAGVKQGPEFQVNTYTTGDQYNSAVASDAAGNFVVVWNDAARTAIMGQRFNSSGGAVGPQFQANVVTTGLRDPRVAIDAADNVMVVWRATLTANNSAILGRRYDSAGVAQGSEFQVNTFTSSLIAYRPDVGAAAGGKFVVTWSNDEGTVRGIFARVYDQTVGPITPEFHVNTYTGGVQNNPALAIRGSDRFVIAWTSLFQIPGAVNDIFGQRFAATSNFYSVTPCRVLDTRNPASPYGGPSLAAHGERTFVFTGRCGISADATAVSVNVVSVNPTTGPGFLTLYPGGTTRPVVATLNYNSGKIRANNAIITLGALGDITAYCGQGSGSADVVVDVNGYFQ